jgi:hypothetical protein
MPKSQRILLIGREFSVVQNLNSRLSSQFATKAVELSPQVGVKLTEIEENAIGTKVALKIDEGMRNLLY